MYVHEYGIWLKAELAKKKHLMLERKDGFFRISELNNRIASSYLYIDLYYNGDMLQTFTSLIQTFKGDGAVMKQIKDYLVAHGHT